jgi:hypothetical protein
MSIHKIGEEIVALHMGGSGVVVRLEMIVSMMKRAQNMATAVHPRKRLEQRCQHDLPKIRNCTH